MYGFGCVFGAHFAGIVFYVNDSVIVANFRITIRKNVKIFLAYIHIMSYIRCVCESARCALNPESREGGEL